MKIFDLTSNSAPMVAKLMSQAKQEWWDYERALEQISRKGMTGWYLGKAADVPLGWICINEVKPFSCIELDSFGFYDNGLFSTEERMAALYDKAEEYAVDKGFRIVRTTMTSMGMSCHNKVVVNYAEELLSLESDNKKYYEYMLSRRYQPAGFMPNCFGIRFHGIILAKDMTGRQYSK